MLAARAQLQNPRPVETVRPLAVAAAYTRAFEALAPMHWSAAIVLAQLFKLYDMERGGWIEKGTNLHDMGAEPGCRRWQVSRDG